MSGTITINSTDLLGAIKPQLLQMPEITQQPYSYIIYTDGTRYYTKNGSTGVIELVDTDASNVIQYAINKATPGQTVFIRTPSPWTTYKLSKPIVPRNGIAIIGEGNPVGSNPVFSQMIFTGGVVLEGDGSFPCILNEDELMNVRIENIGIYNCSYGIKLGNFDKVIGGLILRNVWIQKTIWGIYIINPYFNRFDFIRIINKDAINTRNGMYLASWTSSFDPGNSVFTDIYIDIGKDGTGLMIEGLGGGSIALLEFHRLQIVAHYGTGHGIWVKATNSTPHLITFYDIDLEGASLYNGGYAIRISGSQQIWIYSHLTGGDVLFENSGNFVSRYNYYIAIHGNPKIIDNTGISFGTFIMTTGLNRSNISGTGRALIFTLSDSVYGPLIYDTGIPTGGFIPAGDQTAIRNFFVKSVLQVYASIQSKLTGVISVPEGATSVTIAYPLYVGDPSKYALLLTPSWNTLVWASKSPDRATVYFSNPAPAGATLDWAIIKTL